MRSQSAASTVDSQLLRITGASLLRLLATAFALVASLAQVQAQDALLELDFDSATLTELPGGAVIRTQFNMPDRVPGVEGQAWRTDGFSSWLSAPVDLGGSLEFTIATWVALESYPSDLEVPVNRLNPSSIIHQRRRSRGFDVFVDTYGRWGFWLATSRGQLTLAAPERFPLYEWVHIAAAVDTRLGQATLYINGEAMASEELRRGAEVYFADLELELARSHSEAEMMNFVVNRLNAAYDNVLVFDLALNRAEIQALFTAPGRLATDARESLAVPESRFADDFLRPRFHAMPPANWTNEPHGLVRKDDDWHIFYQRTPNGPYKTQMHWGHMSSHDLLAWRHHRDALWPELQNGDFGFDQKGIWSGDVILDGDLAFAFYTSVNHSDRITASNPGIAMAISEDPDLETWRKTGPIINTEHVLDFRDPYLWREAGAWHMIIGAALESGGGLDYYVLEPNEDGGRWSRRDRFSGLSYRELDIGSNIWEMPVFEPLTEEVRVLVVNPIGGSISKYGEKPTRAVYWTGEWREGLFHPHYSAPKLLDLVPGHLAPTVARANDGMLRAIGIVDERRSPQAQEDAGWAHTFSFPRSWRLLADGETMGQSPAPELLALRGVPALRSNSMALNANPETLSQGIRAYELELNIENASADAILAIDLLASPDRQEFTRLAFDFANETVEVNKSASTLSSEGEGPDALTGDYDTRAFGESRTVRLFVDGSVIEVFVNDAAAFSIRSYPERKDSTGVWLSAPSGSISLGDVTIWPLQQPQ